MNLIHKSDVYFDVIEPMVKNHETIWPRERMHHGDIYIYHNEILLFNGQRWYRADIRDIKKIKSLAHNKEILIEFWNFDLILTIQLY